MKFGGTHSHARIMLVDDEESNIIYLQKLLGRKGYFNVIGVTDAEQALDSFVGMKPDLVVLDLCMPGKNGFEVLEEMRISEPNGHIPIMVLSSLEDEGSRIRALEGGANDYVIKPFGFHEMTSRVHNLLHVRFLYEALQAEKLSLEAKVAARTRDLHESQLEIIDRLSFAAEFRDEGTASHIVRVGRMVRVLAEKIGLQAAEADILMKTARMHDIGKIGVPDCILLKKGPVSSEEWVVLKDHTTIGYKMLCDGKSKLIRTAAEIAYTHHERFDGAGYPRGLMGLEIPLSGRITALCDVFDALTSSRPYKEAWPSSEAAAYIAEQAGGHFDPELARHFLEIMPLMVRIKRENPD